MLLKIYKIHDWENLTTVCTQDVVRGPEYELTQHEMAQGIYCS